MTSSRDIQPQLSKSISARHHNHPRWIIGGKACLDVRRLEELLCLDLPRILRQPMPEQFSGLADRYDASCSDDSGSMSQSSDLSINAELEQVASYLMELVNNPKYTQRIPSSILSEVHSFRGLIYDSNNDSHSAIQAHLRAVWLARKQADCNKEQVQASSSRLAELCRKRRLQRGQSIRSK